MANMADGGRVKQTNWWWILGISSVGLLGLDIVTGQYIQFPILFTIVVILGAWNLGRNAGIGFAIALVGSSFGYMLAFEQTTTAVWVIVLNTTIRLLVLIGLAILIANERQRQILRKRVKILEGILVICSFCKKIRQPDGAWEQIDAYVSKHTDAQFSHGLCKECVQEHYGEFYDPTEFIDTPISTSLSYEKDCDHEQ
jgi:hypothetical protein